MRSHRNSAFFFLVLVTLGSSLSQPLTVTAQQQAQPSRATGNAPISEGREYEYSAGPRRAEASEKQIIIMMPAVPAPQARGLHGSTPLMDAASAGALKAVEALLAKGADVNAQDKFGGTALVYAAREGHTEVVRILIGHRADVNARDTSGTGLHKAARNGHLDIVRLLLAHGAGVDAKDYDGQTALIVALLQGHTDVVLELLRQGANPNAKRRGARYVSALETAVLYRDSLVVTALLTKGVDLDQYGGSALVLSAKEGLTDIVQVLLGSSVNVDTADAWGKTALHRAAAIGHRDIVRLLLARGAQVDSKDRLGATPLIDAVSKGHLKTVTTILANGPNVNLKNDYGRTALSIAAASGQEMIVKTLLDHGADPASKDKHGLNPVVFADIGEYARIVNSLLESRRVESRSPSLIFAKEEGGRCDVRRLHPETKVIELVLPLELCPEQLFVSEGKDTVLIQVGEELREVVLTKTIQRKRIVKLPVVVAHKKELGKPFATAAGYLDDGTLAVHYRSWTPWDTSVEYLEVFDDDKWGRVDTIICGKWEDCRIDTLDGRNWKNWKEERQIWHPMLLLNPYVVDRVTLESRRDDRLYIERAVTFDVGGRKSRVTYSVHQAGHTFGLALYTGQVLLQAAGKTKAEDLCSSQCKVAVVGRYLLLVERLRAGPELIDIETGERLLKGLKFATWMH